MRGRTNITGGNVVVNGELKEFVVADGNIIGKGDFVQYSYVKNQNNSLFQNSFNRYSVQIDETKMLILYKMGTSDTNTTFAAVFDYENNSLIMFSTPLILNNIDIIWNGDHRKVYEENGNLYFAFASQSYREGKTQKYVPTALVIKLNSGTNELSYKIYEIESENSARNDGKVGGCIGKYEDFSSDFVMYGEVPCRIDDDGGYKNPGYDFIFSKISIIINDDDFSLQATKIGSFSKNNERNSETYKYIASSCQLSADSSYITFSLCNVNYGEPDKILIYKIGKEETDMTLTRKFGFGTAGSQNALIKNLTNGVALLVGDSGQELINEYGIFSKVSGGAFFGRAFVESGYMEPAYNLEKMREGVIVGYGVGKNREKRGMEVLNYNTEMQTYEISNTLYTKSMGSNSGGVMNVGGNKHILLEGKGYYGFTYENNVVSEGVEDHGIVKQYETGNALGFAKTGGKAGQNIKVYVPWGEQQKI